MVQLESTEGGGALSGCSQARKSQKGGWAIAVDDADARDRRGVVLPQTALLMPDLPAHRAGKLWHLAYSHDERGRLTETVARSMPQLTFYDNNRKQQCQLPCCASSRAGTDDASHGAAQEADSRAEAAAAEDEARCELKRRIGRRVRLEG